MVVLEASDVFMLGCTFLEVMTGCTREPYDWLSGEALLLFRGDTLTRDLNPLQVGGNGHASHRVIVTVPPMSCMYCAPCAHCFRSTYHGSPVC